MAPPGDYTNLLRRWTEWSPEPNNALMQLIEEYIEELLMLNPETIEDGTWDVADPPEAFETWSIKFEDFGNDGPGLLFELTDYDDPTQGYWMGIVPVPTNEGFWSVSYWERHPPDEQDVE